MRGIAKRRCWWPMVCRIMLWILNLEKAVKFSLKVWESRWKWRLIRECSIIRVSKRWVIWCSFLKKSFRDKTNLFLYIIYWNIYFLLWWTWGYFLKIQEKIIFSLINLTLFTQSKNSPFAKKLIQNNKSTKKKKKEVNIFAKLRNPNWSWSLQIWRTENFHAAFKLQIQSRSFPNLQINWPENLGSRNTDSGFLFRMFFQRWWDYEGERGFYQDLSEYCEGGEIAGFNVFC
jgi:hypothetical protein